MPTENEKQLTAMSEVLQWLNDFDNAPIKPTYANMREKVWQALATERQQLIDAHKDGATFVFKNSETYYNDTFKTQ